MVFTPDNEIYLADSGVTDGNGKVLKYSNHAFEVIAGGFNPPLTMGWILEAAVLLQTHLMSFNKYFLVCGMAGLIIQEACQ